MIEFVKNACCRYKCDRNGNFAITGAITILAIIMSVGAAIDFSHLSRMKSDAQDNADVAALAAAKVMTDNAEASLLKKLTTREAKREARRTARAIISDYRKNSGLDDVQVTIEFLNRNTEVKVTVNAKAKPILSNIFGQTDLNHQAESIVGIGGKERLDIDVALISDATGSMNNILTSIQNNMRNFSTDLRNILELRGIEPGDIRVKFIFYRDFTIDNHTDWKHPGMSLKSGLGKHGPMYTSPFYKLPRQKNEMNKYVDFFEAHGGGVVRESGLEAIWYALNDKEWKNGSYTVRAIVLWTDAPTRPFGDYSQKGLEPGDIYWEPMLEQTMGTSFTALSKTDREAFMRKNYYPKDAPKSTKALKAIYDKFHLENANGSKEIQTMSVNVFDNCTYQAPCGEWPDIAMWDGVTYNYDKGSSSISETYQKTLEQVAETVSSQAKVKDLRILN